MIVISQFSNVLYVSYSTLLSSDVLLQFFVKFIKFSPSKKQHIFFSERDD